MRTSGAATIERQLIMLQNPRACVSVLGRLRRLCANEVVDLAYRARAHHCMFESCKERSDLSIDFPRIIQTRGLKNMRGASKKATAGDAKNRGPYQWRKRKPGPSRPFRAASSIEK